MDNNLLLTWLAKIRIIWLRWWGIYDRWSTITIRHKRGFRRWPTRQRIGRRAARGRQLLNVIGREEPLLPVELASPPICIRFSNYLDDIAFAEGQIIRFLRHRQREISGVTEECLPIRSHYRPIVPLPSARLTVTAGGVERGDLMVVDRVDDHSRSEPGEEARGPGGCVWSGLRGPLWQYRLRLGVGLECADPHRERSHCALQETQRSCASEIQYGQAKLSGRVA